MSYLHAVLSGLWLMVNLNLKRNKLLVEAILKQWPSELDGHLSYCVALSGGIDSVVLLHLLSEARNPNKLNYQQSMLIMVSHPMLMNGLIL